ncbi:hypothetical protein [Streptomyces sp. NPDC087270]|uniref:hypothetical protein n=1 Tax=Streptomyces sp. NPDC087270 TaxID=3365774 RepID=UPI00382206CC
MTPLHSGPLGGVRDERGPCLGPERGLLLVQAPARAWGVSSREVGKTVRAEAVMDEGPQGARP